MRNAVVLAIFSAAVVTAAMAQTTSQRPWHYPADDQNIVSQAAATPYKGNGLPDGVVSILTKYRKPGLRVRRPGRDGYWQFENVAKLYYRGKQFALVGTATCVSPEGHEAGCVNALVIYDEDGDGKLESPVDVNGGKPPFFFHLPKWLQP